MADFIEVFMSLTVQPEKYSITLWMGDAVGSLAHWDVRHEIGNDSPKDAAKIFQRILPDMSFLKCMSDFLLKRSCKVTLIGTEESFKIIHIKGIISAYEKKSEEEKGEESKSCEEIERTSGGSSFLKLIVESL